MTISTKTQFELGRAQVAGPLAVFPILGPQPEFTYVGLARALKCGVSITEVDAQGRVSDVLVANRASEPLLVYEGEAIQGARQNRTFDSSVLVPAGVELRLAVSCVEAGRWDGTRQAEEFRPAAHAPDPALRRSKRTSANRSAASDGQPRADQDEVWHEVASRLDEHDVPSNSSALSDLYDAKRVGLDELCAVIEHVPGQVGALVEISGRPVALDLVSRNEVFAELLPRLASGYALQALGAPVGEPTQGAAEGFLTVTLEAASRWVPTPGMGDAFAISQPGIEGAGLIAGRELVALSAFPAGEPGAIGADRD